MTSLPLVTPSASWLADLPPPCLSCEEHAHLLDRLSATTAEATELLREGRALQEAMLQLQVALRRVADNTSAILREVKANRHPTCAWCGILAGPGHNMPLRREPHGSALVCPPCFTLLQKKGGSLITAP